jgi:hypothetical protein
MGEHYLTIVEIDEQIFCSSPNIDNSSTNQILLQIHRKGKAKIWAPKINTFDPFTNPRSAQAGLDGFDLWQLRHIVRHAIDFNSVDVVTNGNRFRENLFQIARTVLRSSKNRSTGKS